jgi:hypothetical protein
MTVLLENDSSCSKADIIAIEFLGAARHDLPSSINVLDSEGFRDARQTASPAQKWLALTACFSMQITVSAGF